jgi:hypothetical protein
MFLEHYSIEASGPSDCARLLNPITTQGPETCAPAA